MKTIVCTTGTSIARGIEMSADGIGERLKELDENTSSREDYLVQASAESHSLFRMEKDPSVRMDPNAVIHLLHSGTDEGRVCAEALKKLIEAKFERTATTHEVEGLQVTDRNAFRRQGINSLFNELDKIATPCIAAGTRDIALNVTGGFKAVVPYATLFGLIYRIPVVYIFERSKSLIVLPPAPINFDFERIGQAAEAIEELAKAGAMARQSFYDKIKPRPGAIEEGWFDSLLEEEDSLVTLSAFGFLAYRVIQTPEIHLLLSPSAATAYRKATGTALAEFDSIRRGLGNALIRESKLHPFNGTDLKVYKPGNTGSRAAYFEDGENVCVCELWSDHDAYERGLRGKMMEDYKGGKFSTWQKRE